MGKIAALCEKGIAGVGIASKKFTRKLEKSPKEVFYFRRVRPCPAVTHMFLPHSLQRQ